MSEVLNTLNTPEPAQSWEKEVASVAAELPAEMPAPEAAPEPVKVEEAAPEPSQPQETASEEQDRRVPLKALQEERQKRADYERQLAEYQRREQEWQAWAAQQQQAFQQQQMPQEPMQEPDPETDPIGALKYEREQRQRVVEAIQYQQQVAAQQQYVSQLTQVAHQAAVQMQQQVPDYQDAYKYAINSRAQELAALGTPREAIAQIVAQEELRLIDTALQNRKNPAQAIYEFAKARGFQGKPAAPAAPTPDPAMQEAKRAVAASASAGGAPASKGNITPADLVHLKGAAFDAAWNKLFGGNNNSIFRE